MIQKVIVVTDSTACIPKEMAEELSIAIVPIELVFGDKVYRDGIDLTPEEFYSMLRKADKLPTTAGSLPAPFLEVYRKASQKGRSIFCITESSKFSGMYNSAVMAADMIKKEEPDLKVEVMECTTAAAGQGLVVLAAAEGAAGGRSLSEVAEAARKVMSRTYLYATLDTLFYLIKGGRVPKVAGLANSILRWKPVFSVNGGDAHTVALPRTTDSAIRNILRLMSKKINKQEAINVAIMHADALERAKGLKEKITARFNCNTIYITEFTPVMGVHTGPGVVGAAFYQEIGEWH